MGLEVPLLVNLVGLGIWVLVYGLAIYKPNNDLNYSAPSRRIERIPHTERNSRASLVGLHFRLRNFSYSTGWHQISPIAIRTTCLKNHPPFLCRHTFIVDDPLGKAVMSLKRYVGVTDEK